ncbi:ABC transporter ATP-binding protein [Sulfitobacter sp. M57]|uniref:ABC transporter ATP-binding protein n=1 Tax=unclassified Sulfitobacter TaxID=196795 RepID=UPI0023E22CF0|nr:MULTISPECIES: ABC transporter ATP-binding protein [unclassified Sulfitobacter]MDF3413751.1 ABC transporter ATP-binding protein [Sulfitobacter sp. KE5]MDF3420968.1 ABC transporter ATP-binding protein [Sulfitobacter sp. KE43]MDF3432297.1 ABC transporter ATP-binding protein [Sulfitobacter sp. KE42]MDF3457936.1 ABC transporter ATP-binding protein [Sulfitobacter sp. S74]MDF3461837.1 ABC transporter ATP-binding protein [Sulfitobacter sp. Ks18]
MLEVKNIHAAYGDAITLHGVSFDVQPSEILCLLGRNGAGKTTTLKTVMGILPVTSGSVTLEGEEMSSLPPHEIPRRGIGYIPQGRRLFPELTVNQNIEIGLMTRGMGKDTKEWVLELFPRLRERLKQTAGTLSGGEQQMLATARALCLRPKVLLLDEPTEGLQPSMIALIRDVILKMKNEGFAIVLVEQKVDAVLQVADRVVFIENGRSVDRATAADLKRDPQMLTQYLGV